MEISFYNVRYGILAVVISPQSPFLMHF